MSNDESRFCFYSYDERQRVHRKRGERQKIQFSLERKRALAGGVMFWGAISYGSRSLLAFLEKNVNSQSYINNVLKLIAILYLRQLENPILLIG